MRFIPRCLFLGALFAIASSVSVEARAQTPPETKPDDPNGVVPPRLVKFVEATLGEHASEPVSVLTELTIDETGHVTAASIVESGGEAIDRAVLDAVRAFEFEPARKGGTPISVTIRYHYRTEPEKAEPAPPVPVAAAVPVAKATPPRAEKPSAAKPATSDELEEYSATAEVEAPPREPLRRSIGGTTLTRVPGTGGDPVKAIEILPGVARTNGGGDPLLRGAAWNESQSLLDGVPVPFLFHFGGLTSFMHPRLIERVDVYPSNFSTRYGRLTGGIVEVHARDPRTDGFHGILDLNIIDSSALVETPLGQSTAIALAARRSNIDFFFDAFVPEDAYSVLAAPVYWDYQAMLVHHFDKKNKLKVMVYGGHDAVDLLFSDPVDEDPTLDGSVGGTIQFHRVQASFRTDFSSTASQELTAAIADIDIEQHIGELVQQIRGPELDARGEWSFELLPSLRLTTGVDFFGWFASGKYHGPLPGQSEGNPASNSPLASQRIISLETDSFDVVRPGAYVELGFRPVENLLFVPGLRGDFYPGLHAGTLDPRLTARWDLTQKTALKGGVGLYSQPPEDWQTLEAIGNPDLKPYHALHTSLGVEERVVPSLKLGLEGFYKWMYNRVVSTPTGAAPHLVNDGEGRIIGAEVSGEWKPQEGTFAYLGYTLSRSERRDLDGEWRLFDQDQTHILTLAAGHELGKGWNIGARFRLTTGNPTTPVTDSVYDARSGVYVPVYGAVNSERDPTFQQLDVRVEKIFRIGTGSLSVYLDLQNAYNATNQQGVRYSYDYRQKEPVSGIPILPNLGLRGEL